MAVITTRYQSQALGGFVTFQTILPFEDFGPNPIVPNPDPYRRPEGLRTLYLLHGITGDDRDWLLGTRIARYAAEHRIAVVMPDGRNSFYVDQTPTDRWGEFIGKELVDVTRTLFPLSHRREDTFLGGLSMGGYGALRNGLKYNDTFSRIVGLSSALVFYDIPNTSDDTPIPWQKKSYYERIFGDVHQLAEHDMDPEDLFLRCQQPVDLFLAVGTEDFLLDYNRRFRDFLLAHNASLTYHEEPGAHEWDFWDRNIARALDWLCS